MNRKLLALAPIIAASSIIRQNKKLKVRKTTLKFNKLPQAFDNFKIAQVSDIHCDRIGYSDLSFIKKIKNFNPDIIVITGDILDSYNNDMDIAYNILSQLAIIAPCYFVILHIYTTVNCLSQKIMKVLIWLELRIIISLKMKIS